MRQPVVYGKYLLLDRISVGGMAEVFMAKSFGDEGFEKILAIKRILPSMAEDDEFIDMFIDEAKISGQFSHPNIGQIYELGQIESSHFIAMEYVWGKDILQLQNRFRKQKQRIPIPMAAFIAAKVCDGLDYAHRKRDESGRPMNIIHRDVSPQNVLVSYHGEVKIIDFGIAKARSRSSKTQAGVLKGKFGYMSPEQVRALPLDQRSDIFAIGTLLWEMCTGERLFSGDNDLAVLEKVRNAQISSPSKVCPQISPRLENIIMRALMKDPDDRYTWASEMQEELNDFLMTQQPIFSDKSLAQVMNRLFENERKKEEEALERYRQFSFQDLQRFTPSPQLLGHHSSDFDGGPILFGNEVKSVSGSVDDRSPPPKYLPATDLAKNAPLLNSSSGEVLLPTLPEAPEEIGDHNVADTKIFVESGEQFIGAETPRAITASLIYQSETAQVESIADPLPLLFEGQPGNGSHLAPEFAASGVGTNGNVLFDASLNILSGDPENLQILSDGLSLSTGAGSQPRYSLARDIFIGIVLALIPLLAVGAWFFYSEQQEKSSTDIKLGIDTPLPQTVYHDAASASSVAKTTASPTKGMAVSVRLRVEPASARVMLDGQELSKEALSKPLSFTSTDKHHLVVEKEGYTKVDQDLDLSGGPNIERTIKLEEEKFGQLMVRSTPAGATITINGENKGKTPQEIKRLPSGSYYVTLSLDGGPSKSQWISVASGKTAELLFTLEAGKRTGSEATASADQSASATHVKLKRPDEKKAPTATASSTPKVPTIQQTKPTPAPATKTTAKATEEKKPTERKTAAAKEDEESKPKPKPKTTAAVAAAGGDADEKPSGNGYLVANTVPWSKVIIDGKDTGLTTPITPANKIPLKPGTHKITFESQGQQFNFTISISAGEITRLIKKLSVEEDD